MAQLQEGVKPALLLLDLAMPVLDGIQTLEELQKTKAYEHLPVIVLSAQNAAETVREAVRLGACDYILKPFDFSNFNKRVNEWVYRPDLKAVQALLVNLRLKGPDAAPRRPAESPAGRPSRRLPEARGRESSLRPGAGGCVAGDARAAKRG